MVIARPTVAMGGFGILTWEYTRAVDAALEKIKASCPDYGKRADDEALRHLYECPWCTPVYGELDATCRAAKGVILP